jgi:hypothetical protein
MLVDWEFPNPHARRSKDCVTKGCSKWGYARLAYATRWRIRINDIRMGHARRFIHARYGIIMKITLLHGSISCRDLSPERKACSEHCGSLELRFY